MHLALEFNVNSEPVKYVIIAISFPVWLPFLKALYEEFNDALREEGGLFGNVPTAEELEAIRRKPRVGVSAFFSEPKDGFTPRANPRDAQPGGTGGLQRGGGGRTSGLGAREGGDRGATHGFRS